MRQVQLQRRVGGQDTRVSGQEEEVWEAVEQLKIVSYENTLTFPEARDWLGLLLQLKSLSKGNKMLTYYSVVRE